MFLRNQDITPGQMKELCERLSRLAGCVSLVKFLISRNLI